MVMVSCSCCATIDLSSGVRAALNRFIIEKVDPQRVVLPQEPPESVVGNSSIDVIMRVRDFGVVVIEVLPDDSGSPGDASE